MFRDYFDNFAQNYFCKLHQIIEILFFFSILFLDIDFIHWVYKYILRLKQICEDDILKQGLYLYLFLITGVDVPSGGERNLPASQATGWQWNTVLLAKYFPI